MKYPEERIWCRFVEPGGIFLDRLHECRDCRSAVGPRRRDGVHRNEFGPAQPSNDLCGIHGHLRESVMQRACATTDQLQACSFHPPQSGTMLRAMQMLIRFAAAARLSLYIV